MALVVRGTSNSSFRIVPSSNGYKALIRDDDKDIDIIYFQNSNIGIGTDNPIERFEIKNGIVRISKDNNNKSLNINNNQVIFNNPSKVGFIGIENNSNYIQMTNEGSMKGFIFNGEVVTNEIRPEIDKWHRTIDGNSRFYFSSNSTSFFGSSNGYQWNNSSNQGITFISNNGYMGIGVSNPKSQIHIHSTINQFPLKISSGNSNGTFISLNTDDVQWSKCAIGHIKTSNFDIGDLLFLTRNSIDATSVSLIDEKMRITSSGLIGIGITNPRASLHIHNKGAIIKLTDNSNVKGLSLYNTSNSYLINHENTNLMIGCGTCNQREAVRIDNSNNLNINNNLNFDCINNTEISITTAQTTKSSFLYFDNSMINIGRDLGYGSRIATFHNNIIVNSNMGIGVASPIEKLHVNGVIATMTSDTRNYIRFFNDSTTAFIDVGSANEGIAFRINNTDTDYGVNPIFNEMMRIKSNGNVGIGNNNPITNGTDTNLCIGNSSLLNSSGFLIIGKNSSGFKRHFKLGYGDANFVALGDFGTNNNPGTWKQQLKIHWNCPINTLLIYENGDANLYGRLYQTSDRKIKKDVKIIENALLKVNQLNGVEYVNINDNSSHIGLIAQDVEPIIPQVVNYNPETDLKSVAYGNLTPLLINAIKELSEKIRVLEAIINDKN